MPTYTTAYTVGDRVRLSFSVLSTASTYIDTAVTFIVNPPTGDAWVRSAGPISGTTAITRTAAGRWRADYTITEPGYHLYALRSTGSVTSSTDGAFAARALVASS